jgi:hypothetical protein
VISPRLEKLWEAFVQRNRIPRSASVDILEFANTPAKPSLTDVSLCVS